VGDEEVAGAVAHFVRSTSLDAIPAEVRERAKRVVADTAAAIIAGSSGDVAAPLAHYLDRSRATGPSRVIGWGDAVPAETAAFVNATLGHSLDYDDVVTLYPAHPSSVVISALLASDEEVPLDGDRFLEAYIVGVEAGAQIGRGIGLGHYNRGFHATGTLAPFAGIAALAKIYSLDEKEIRRALGVGASFSSGMRRNFGTMSKPMHSGWAARSATVAVELVRVGWTANDAIFEGPDGFFAMYGDEESDLGAVAPALGVPYVYLDPGVALKKYPCCYGVHRAIDAVLEIRDAVLPADAVERIECRLPPLGLTQLPYRFPDTGLEAKFSMEYTLGATLIDGAITLESFSEEAVRRPEVRALYGRMDIARSATARRTRRSTVRSASWRSRSPRRVGRPSRHGSTRRSARPSGSSPGVTSRRSSSTALARRGWRDPTPRGSSPASPTSRRSRTCASCWGPSRCPDPRDRPPMTELG
jgi:2-methylcitrate dehydratase PrpD